MSERPSDFPRNTRKFPMIKKESSDPDAAPLRKESKKGGFQKAKSFTGSSFADPWSNRTGTAAREPLRIEPQDMSAGTPLHEQPSAPLRDAAEISSAGSVHGNGSKRRKGLFALVGAAIAAVILFSAAGVMLLLPRKALSQQAEERVSDLSATRKPEERASATSDGLLRKDDEPVRSADALDLYDVVTFGRYPQRENGEEEPIRWYVIGKTQNKVTLLSVSGLDSRPYHETPDAVSLLDSDVYRWLNESFRTKAFTDEEKQIITKPVSLLSKKDAEQMPKEYRVAVPTAYAIRNGADASESSWWVADYDKSRESRDRENRWWYNSARSDAAYCVNAAGETAEVPVNRGGGSIRPMIVIRF